MESISCNEHVIWGTSLGMATDEEIDDCYKQIKKYILGTFNDFAICKFSKKKKDISPSSVMLCDNLFQHYTKAIWGCGRECKKGDLCDVNSSIKLDDLAKAIESMVNNKINVDGGNVVKVLKDKIYISIYLCNRVFFIK